MNNNAKDGVLHGSATQEKNAERNKLAMDGYLFVCVMNGRKLKEVELPRTKSRILRAEES